MTMPEVKRCKRCGWALRKDNKSGICGDCQRDDWFAKGCPRRMTREEHIALSRLKKML
jgi:predicted amidophosphoribosyltransferase